MMSDDIDNERCRCPLCGAPVIASMEYDFDGKPIVYYDFDVSQYTTFGTANSIDYFVIESGAEEPNTYHGGGDGN